MSKRFASISEGDAAQFLATLNVLPCQSFTPYFQTEFTDKRGFTGTYLPDFKYTCLVTGKVTFFETKFAALNSKQSHEASEKNFVRSIVIASAAMQT